jgi:TetR/AcrR family transcriptional repressor of nem operon
MKVTKEQAARNKDSILEAAAQLYREHGVDGVGIGQLARSVGLTHGGFYGQFPGGKEQLVAEAVSRAFEPNVNGWNAMESLAEIVEGYVSQEHVDDMSHGCPIPLMGADVARTGGSARATFTAGVRDMLAALEKHAGDQPESVKQTRAAQQLASMVGAVLIARAVDDPALAAMMLQSVIEGCTETPR